MLTKRIIACLDMDGGRVVKGVRFKHLRDAGDPAECAAAQARNGADEIVLLDITATSGNRGTLLDAVRSTARSLFVPFAVGGGIRQLEDATAVFDAGADKIAVNSAAVRDPGLIGKIAGRFGSQAVVVAIDARKVERRLRSVRCGRTRAHRPGCDSVGSGGCRSRSGRDLADLDGPGRNEIRI